MSVSATTSASHLPIEWAGVIVPEGDVQAFDLAFNDAEKTLDQGLVATTPALGTPGLTPAVDALSSRLQIQNWATGMRPPVALPAATPIADQALEGPLQALAPIMSGLLSDAGLKASAEDEPQADQDMQASAAQNVLAGLQVAGSMVSNKSQAPRPAFLRQDNQKPADGAAITTEADESLISSGPRPVGFPEKLANDMPLSSQLGSSPATSAKTPRARDAHVEADSGLPDEKDGKTQELPSDPAPLFAAPPNVQRASPGATDSPPPAPDGNTAASDLAVANGAPAPQQDNAVMPGQPRPIDSSGFAASMSDNHVGRAQSGLNRQDGHVVSMDQPGASVPAAPVAQPMASALQTSRGLGKGLALEMRKSIEDGREQMRVRLDPKELGQLDVRLSFEKDGALRAVITASTAASNDLLRQELPTLVRNLSDAGVRMDAGSLRFELQSDSGGSSGQRQTFQENPRAPSRNGSGEDLRPEEDVVFGTRPWRARGQFDLRA